MFILYRERVPGAHGRGETYHMTRTSLYVPYKNIPNTFLPWRWKHHVTCYNSSCTTLYKEASNYCETLLPIWDLPVYTASCPKTGDLKFCLNSNVTNWFEISAIYRDICNQCDISRYFQSVRYIAIFSISAIYRDIFNQRDISRYFQSVRYIAIFAISAIYRDIFNQCDISRYFQSVRYIAIFSISAIYRDIWTRMDCKFETTIRQPFIERRQWRAKE